MTFKGEINKIQIEYFALGQRMVNMQRILKSLQKSIIASNRLMILVNLKSKITNKRVMNCPKKR